MPSIRPPRITIQMANCVRATRATPMILPIISSNDETLETMTSTMRLVFSSMTPRITMEPNMKTNMYIRKLRI